MTCRALSGCDKTKKHNINTQNIYDRENEAQQEHPRQPQHYS